MWDGGSRAPCRSRMGSPAARRSSVDPAGWASGWAAGWTKVRISRCYRTSNRRTRPGGPRGRPAFCAPGSVSYWVPRLFAHERVQLNTDAEQISGVGLLRRGHQALDDQEARRLVEQVYELGEVGVAALIGRTDIHLGERIASLYLVQFVRDGARLDAGLLGHTLELGEDGGKRG